MANVELYRLLHELECYLQDDIGQLMEEGYQDHPGSAIDCLHKMLDGCIEWQEKIKDNPNYNSDGK
jgi:hypothetical protein